MVWFGKSRVELSRIDWLDYMEQEECIISDQVRINGRTTAAALSAAGQLRWDDRRLDIEKEVLGFSVDGFKVKIRAVVEAGAGICCCGGKSSLIRRTFVLELLSNDSLRIWTQKLQEYLDSLGKFLSSLLCFFCGDWSKIMNHNSCCFCCKFERKEFRFYQASTIFFGYLSFQFCVFGFRQA